MTFLYSLTHLFLQLKLKTSNKRTQVCKFKIDKKPTPTPNRNLKQWMTLAKISVSLRLALFRRTQILRREKNLHKHIKEISSDISLILGCILRITKFLNQSIFKNSRPEVFCKKGVLKNFTKLTEKHLSQSLQLYQKRDSGAGAFL